MKISSAIKIIRPVNFIISCLSIFVAGFIADFHLINLGNILLASFSGALIGAAGNVINDFFDFEIDKINRPNRVLVRGDISKLTAVWYYILLNIIALFMASQIGLFPFFIAFSAFLLIFSYSAFFKTIPLLGNFIVSAFTGIAFIYGAISAGSWQKGIIPLVFAFLINFIREIVKDVEDIKGDAANSVITFPSRFGIKNTKYLLNLLILILLIATTVPFLYQIYRIEYLLFVLFTVDVLLIRNLKILNSDSVNYSRVSAELKIAMGFGLISIVVGNL